jgi:hypothetical protein
VLESITEMMSMETINWIKDVETGKVDKDQVDICVHCFGMNKKIDMTYRNTIHGPAYVCNECLNKIYTGC